MARNPLAQTLVCMLAGVVAGVATAAAQAPADSARGGVVGTVLDGATGQPLAGAVVVLAPRQPGLFAPVAAGQESWALGVSAVTHDDGGYHFARIPAGQYRLYVRRLGYAPRSIELDVRWQGELRVSVGLVVEPIVLEPTVVELPRATFARHLDLDDANRGARIAAERVRQDRYLATDARTLTNADVVEAVTLGETDLFRAFQRVPGVATRDDFTAELWTRGAPWSETRVMFDGMPLFNPLHTVGVFTGVNPDAVGAVYFEPGARSAAEGEGAAAVLDIASRQGGPGPVRGDAGLSVVSARAAMEGGLGERGGWMLAARRSYIDFATALLADSAAAVPYAFTDLSARADMPVHGLGTLSVSGLWEQDDVRGDVRDLLRGNTGSWGNGVAQATLTVVARDLLLREQLGVSRFDGNVAIRTATATAADTSTLVTTSAPTANGLTYVAARTSVEPLTGAWKAGFDLVAQRQAYDGPVPRPYPSAVLLDTLRLRTSLWTPALWGELRPSIGPVRVAAGLRVEAPSVGSPVLAPRLSARWALTPSIGISVGAARSFQYAQAIAPAGPGVGPDLHLTDVWLMASDTIPAVRADIVTAGVEAWLGGPWLGAVNLYARHATGVAVPDPVPGTLNPGRPIFLGGENRAGGVELSLRRLAGPWTGSLSYTFGTSRMRTAGFEYPASADRRHVFDLTAMTRVGPALRVGGAVTAATGAPYTRFLLERAVPCDSGGSTCEVVTRAKDVEAPNANRTRPYFSADLMADWSHAFHSWRMDVFLQLRNTLDRRNAVTYLGSYEACTPQPGDLVPRPGTCDRFDRGLPLLPLIGVNVSF